MPAKYELTWDDEARRWRVQHDGRRHIVSCRQLVKLGFMDAATPQTKATTYQAANKWWSTKLTELGNAPAAPHPHQAVIDELHERKRWAEHQADRELVRTLEGNLATATEDHDPDSASALDIFCLGTPENKKFWADRLARDESPVIPQDRKIGAQIARFNQIMKAKAAAGEIVPAEAENRRHALAFFEDWIGANVAVDGITESRWTDYYTHLLELIAGEKRSRSYCEKLLRYSRTFVEFLDDERIVTAPRNLRKLRFKQATRAVQPMAVDEVRKLIDAASGPLKLHLLLMINCGFTQQDVSDLHPSEVRDGSIIRKRSKTQDHAEVPIVRYRLWPETLSLMDQFRSNDLDHYLVTKSGAAWVRKEYKAGKFLETDSIRTLYARHAKAVGINKSLKYLRKTSATLLDTKWDDRTTTLFLGHSPRSLKDKHYSRPADEVLDEALAWLRIQYFPAE